jgi:hypothetical protein
VTLGVAISDSISGRPGFVAVTVPRNTGLLSHSAAPLLQLASLRRPGSRLPIDRQRSSPVVSTAFLIPGTRFSVTRYPRIARLDILLIATQRQRQNVEPGTSHRCAPLVLTGVREPRAPLSTKRRAPAGVQYTVLCRLRSSFDGHNTVWGSPGSGLPEKSVTATKQAVETPEGGRIRPSATNTTRHRRAASRSGGATSAERDGRPVGRRTESRRRLQPQRQGQRQLQQTAPGPVAVTGIRTRARGRSRARSRTKPLLSTKIPSGSVRDRFSGSRQPPPDPATNI